MTESSIAEELLPKRDDAEVRRVGRALIDVGLGRGGSLFEPARSAWSLQSVETLHRHYNQQVDEGGDTFLVKLQRQLAGAPDDTVLLAAELLTLQALPVANFTQPKKRERISTVLSWLRDPVRLPAEVDAAFAEGSWNGGTGAHTMLWKWLLDAVTLLQEWWQLPEEERSAALANPWAWRGWVRRAPGIPSLREALLYLAFPSHFLPIINVSHKKAIRLAFAHLLPAPTGDDLDRDLFQIMLRLQAEHSGPVDPYLPPFVDEWREKTRPADERRAWLVRPWHGEASQVRLWREGGFVSVPGAHLAGLAPDADRAEVRAAVEAGYQHLDYTQRMALTSEYHAFWSVMGVDDLVATVVDDQLSAGVVTGQPSHEAGERAQLRRAVEWLDTAPVPVGQLAVPLPAELERPGTVVDITRALDVLAQLVEVAPEDTSGEGDDEPPLGAHGLGDAPAVQLAEVTPELAGRLHLDRDWLQELVDVLGQRKQVVLYGPPGTGKTYLAQALAHHIATGDAVQLVQFHPSYSYEDFFEGFRPTKAADGSVGFTLTAGPLRLLVSQAQANITQPHVLIVDEINRANLAKVFGELYFLLEYRDRSIRLQYSPEQPFWLPPNVFIIGTMNTADRSIALLDAAIRRRFAFVELHPDEPPVRDLLSRWLAANGADNDERPGLLRALNDAIADEDRDFKIGPSYLMRPEAHSPHGLARIWRHDLLPLLEEHYHGRLTRAELHDRFSLDTIRGQLPPTETTEPVEAAEAEPQDGPS